MERTVETKFYTFRQNNSKGYFIVNDDVAVYVIVEATSEENACARLNDITQNYSEYCSCCGLRWSHNVREEGDVPLIYGEDARTLETQEKQEYAIIYYIDGKKEKTWTED